MDSLIVGQAKYFEDDGSHVVAAPIRIGADCHEVWFRVADGPLASGVEPFLAATLMPAMKLGRAVAASGTVSRRLIETIPTIQDIVHAWWPEFQRVPVEVKAKRAHTSPPQDVGCFFTGGVDSFYTLLKHKEEITKLIFVHGFDVQLDDIPLREKVSQALREVARDLRKPLIEVETNLRTFSEPHAEWGEFHGNALASVTLLLSPQFRKFYIPSTYAYAQLHPWGSHPLLDPLWSTDNTEIVHDGCEATRIEKVAQISSCEIVLRSLRSCYRNPGGAYNCGQCEKCIRTMALLRAVGVLDRCTTFDGTLDLRALSRLPYKEHSTLFLPETLQVAIKLGADPALVQALRDCVNQRFHRGIWRVASGVRSRVHRLVHRVTNMFS